MHILVATLVGGTFGLQVHPSSTVADVKELIFAIRDLSPHRQQLLFDGKVLRDGHTLASAGIRDGSTLTLVINMSSALANVITPPDPLLYGADELAQLLDLLDMHSGSNYDGDDLDDNYADGEYEGSVIDRGPGVEQGSGGETFFPDGCDDDITVIERDHVRLYICRDTEGITIFQVLLPMTPLSRPDSQMRDGLYSRADSTCPPTPVTSSLTARLDRLRENTRQRLKVAELKAKLQAGKVRRKARKLLRVRTPRAAQNGTPSDPSHAHCVMDPLRSQHTPKPPSIGAPMRSRNSMHASQNAHQHNQERLQYRDSSRQPLPQQQQQPPFSHMVQAKRARTSSAAHRRSRGQAYRRPSTTAVLAPISEDVPGYISPRMRAIQSSGKSESTSHAGTFEGTAQAQKALLAQQHSHECLCTQQHIRRDGRRPHTPPRQQVSFSSMCTRQARERSRESHDDDVLDLRRRAETETPFTRQSSIAASYLESRGSFDIDSMLDTIPNPFEYDDDDDDDYKNDAYFSWHRTPPALQKHSSDDLLDVEQKPSPHDVKDGCATPVLKRDADGDGEGSDMQSLLLHMQQRHTDDAKTKSLPTLAKVHSGMRRRQQEHQKSFSMVHNIHEKEKARHEWASLEQTQQGVQQQRSSGGRRAADVPARPMPLEIVPERSYTGARHQLPSLAHHRVPSSSPSRKPPTPPSSTRHRILPVPQPKPPPASQRRDVSATKRRHLPQPPTQREQKLKRKKAQKKPRCAHCKKKLKGIEFTCRCAGVFCARCRLGEVHGCVFNYQAQGREQLRKALPQVTPTKLPKI